MGFLYFIGIFFHKEKKSKKQQHFHRKNNLFIQTTMAPKTNATKATIAPVAKKAAKKEAPKKAVSKTAHPASTKKVVRVSQRKAYTRPQFRRPTNTYRRPKAAKPDANTKGVKSSWDEFRVVKSPLVTDRP